MSETRRRRWLIRLPRRLYSLCRFLHPPGHASQSLPSSLVPPALLISPHSLPVCTSLSPLFVSLLPYLPTEYFPPPLSLPVTVDTRTACRLPAADAAAGDNERLRERARHASFGRTRGICPERRSRWPPSTRLIACRRRRLSFSPYGFPPRPMAWSTFFLHPFRLHFMFFLFGRRMTPLTTLR